MPDTLTDAQRMADVCPDCGDDPNEVRPKHWPNCRRVAQGSPLQYGPPWTDWPEEYKDA